MKSKLLFALIVILITSCNPIQTPDFEFIDFSINRDRVQEFYSLKIFPDGKAFIKENVHIFSYKEYKYVLTLNKDVLDTITLLTKAIVNSKLDSIYYTECLSCMDFNLIIKTKENKLKFFHRGDLNSNDKYKILEDYVRYLNKLIDISMSSVDSSLKFESWTDRLLPPPPPLPPMKHVDKE
jgi:hypothetical protein